MNAQSYKLVVAATLGAWLAFSGAAFAQNTNTAPRGERRGPSIEKRVDRLTTELNLNQEQQAKVKSLFEKQATERREILNLPREERREKMRALMQDENSELKTILTSEQFQKWQKLREQMRARRGGNPGEPGNPAPAPAPAPEPKNP
ncbi:MAG TPA: hypothetical protein VKY92_18515 [Verrucomicrobiae bacterium]|jgi:Spy/CpxP family protein refolding chaperone|nr:hypothetical protein [Verrucomicrobiae bacterium]